MKKQALFILGVVALFMAQAKPPAYTLVEPTPDMPLHAELLVPGWDVDQMVSKTNLVLLKMVMGGWTVVSSRKGSGRLFPLYSWSLEEYPTTDPNRKGLFIRLDKEFFSLKLTVDWYRVAQEPKRPKAQAKAFYDEFFRRLADAMK
jgi:hypothetical protein